MNWKRLAKRVGIGIVTEAVRQPTIADVDEDTAIGLNDWAVESLQVSADNLPFPFIHDGKKELGSAWDIPANSWGIIFPAQRQFWLHYTVPQYYQVDKDIQKFRVINGRKKPMGY